MSLDSLGSVSDVHKRHTFLNTNIPITYINLQSHVDRTDKYAVMRRVHCIPTIFYVYLLYCWFFNNFTFFATGCYHLSTGDTLAHHSVENNELLG